MENEKAKQRQQEAGKLYGRGEHTKEKVTPNLVEALDKEKGEALEKAAKKVGVGKGSLWKAKKINFLVFYL